MARCSVEYVSLIISCYTFNVAHKTTIVLDQRKLSRVRRVLGTTGIKETVDRAFDEILAIELRKRAVARLIKMDGIDLADRAVMGRAWR
jgi:Arc/MetJ family transcription regulator